MKRELGEVAGRRGGVNRAAVPEKSFRHGAASTLHLWWAPRSLEAVRAEEGEAGTENFRDGRARS
ncbi:MAG TPA: DUF1156 domain-containing protein [Gemmatimonadales bacterium]|nr:DUF1156 domain-containing protein [Gemmatimonadales bacterium]